MSTSEQDAMRQLEEAGFLDHDPAHPPVVTNEDSQWADDEMRSMLDIAQREVTVWIASAQEPILFGKVVDISEVESEYKKDKMVPLLTIETPTSRLVQVFCWHTVLCNEVERQIKRENLQIGSRIVIRYTGTRPSSKGVGNDTTMYRVVARRP